MKPYWIIIALFLALGMEVQAQRNKIDTCSAQSGSCSTIFGTVPDRVAAGVVQQVALDTLGTLVQNHHITWTSTPPASADGVTVTVSATTDGTNYLTILTLNGASGTAVWSGLYRRIGVSVKTDGSTDVSYYGSGGPPTLISGVNAGQPTAIAVDPLGNLLLSQPVQIVFPTTLPLQPCNALVKTNCQK